MKPLATQVTDPTDSLFSRTPGLVKSLPLAGLNTTYQALVTRAFAPKYWAAAGAFRVDPERGAVIADPARGYTQMEHNFSLFWGLAIQAYEATLISDDSAFDRGPAAMTAAALRGAELFSGKAGCASCHNGPLLSAATVSSADAAGPNVIDGRLMADGYPAVVDRGFANTGVRPAAEDRGAGAVDPYGFDLSFSRQFKWQQAGKNYRAPDRLIVNPCAFSARIAPDCRDIPSVSDPAAAVRDAVDGAFKVPSLRNVGLTPPYFHNGGQSNLKAVLQFYNRGGDRRGSASRDTTGLPSDTPFKVRNGSNLDPAIGSGGAAGTTGLGLSEEEMDDVIQFLLSLTDQRVACHSGVFDHPQLPLVIGQRDSPASGSNRAKDIVATLPAVGASGLNVCLPNTGDLFGTLNTTDRRKLPDVLEQILR
jgi:mono/diheme cytochrome c family protein